MSAAARRYAQVVQDHMARPFEWGRTDCATFAAAVVRAIDGRDLLGALPRWASAAEAARVLRDAGGFACTIDRLLQVPRKPAAWAAAGDIVLAWDDEALREQLAVCNGRHLLAPGASGLTTQPLTAGLMAWPLHLAGRGAHG